MPITRSDLCRNTLSPAEIGAFLGPWVALISGHRPLPRTGRHDFDRADIGGPVLVNVEDRLTSRDRGSRRLLPVMQLCAARAARRRQL